MFINLLLYKINYVIIIIRFFNIAIFYLLMSFT